MSAAVPAPPVVSDTRSDSSPAQRLTQSYCSPCSHSLTAVSAAAVVAVGCEGSGGGGGGGEVAAEVAAAVLQLQSSAPPCGSPSSRCSGLA